MRPQKLPRAELLSRCANTLKQSGYHGTSMEALATACGLTKASFYHHYKSKEALVHDVLTWTHEQIRDGLFSIAYQEGAPRDRLTKLGRKGKKLFMHPTVGCLMGIISVDAAGDAPELMKQVRDFMNEWGEALAHILGSELPRKAAQDIGRQAVSDYEGAILMARIYGDTGYFDRVTERLLGLLPETAP
ncbi:TetR/AcrR family transcriptional regulator [Alloalcanivorax profundimaris]|jgi:TetR/AcrR family transcriptional repressor of nem operon|uniref:TetR/AcrR family transcriptional regulator n=1 Tax=Alloalcanivorax profundimaris TaxID=2735259 RepID=UPI001886D34B|nr:TetR/AcrR family transcriptional regulator [Alloalcanivorax profundimaris]MBF1800863.1 TetR/AcrR family transcriptional regulator [Alloalcanivorax profundimaris]